MDKSEGGTVIVIKNSVFSLYLAVLVARDPQFVFGIHDAQPCGLRAGKEMVGQLLSEGDLEDFVLNFHVHLYRQTLQSIQDVVIKRALLVG